MAEEKKQPASVNIQLASSGPAEQPVLANFTRVHPSPGVALVDFGFLDPGALAAVSRLARSGKKMPERMNGVLSARVALTYDAAANLHRQLTAVLQAAAKAARRAPEDKPS